MILLMPERGSFLNKRVSRRELLPWIALTPVIAAETLPKIIAGSAISFIQHLKERGPKSSAELSTPFPAKQSIGLLENIQLLEKKLPVKDFSTYKELAHQTVVLATHFFCEQIAADFQSRIAYNPGQLIAKFVLHNSESFAAQQTNSNCIKPVSTYSNETLAEHDLEAGLINMDIDYASEARPESPLELIASAAIHELVHTSPSATPPLSGEKVVVDSTKEIFDIAFHYGFSSYAVHSKNSKPGRSCLIIFNYYLEEAIAEDYTLRLVARANVRSFIHKDYQRLADKYRNGILNPFFPGPNGYLQALEYHQQSQVNDLFAFIARKNNPGLSYVQAVREGSFYTDMLFKP